MRGILYTRSKKLSHAIVELISLMGEYAPNAPSTLGVAIVCGRSCEWLYRTPRWWKLVYKFVESFDEDASNNRSINVTDG